MKKYALKSGNRSHTFERSLQAPHQPSLNELLQRYKRDAIGGGTHSDNWSTGVSQMNRFTDFYRAKYGEKPAQIGERIPRIIHRFWSGGPLHPNDLNNIIQMQQRIKERNKDLGLFASKWRQKVWTSRSFNKKKRISHISYAIRYFSLFRCGNNILRR